LSIAPLGKGARALARFANCAAFQCGLVAGFLTASAHAGVRLPNVFGDHMVLQREMPVPVWGWADPGEKVTVTFAETTVEATANATGRWTVKLPALPASSEGRAMTVSGKNTLTFNDVLVGEVWLCGGQSNMESEMNWCSPEEGRTASLPTFRRVKAEHILAPTPQSDVKASWTICDRGNANGFTAAGFYFARKLTQELKVPVGLLDTSWGGANITFWIPGASYQGMPELRPQWENETAQAQAMTKTYLERLATWTTEARRSLETKDIICSRPPWMPERREFSHMFNGMVHPFAPYAIRGMLWYQGEYNANDGNYYFDEMRGLIQGWRDLWQQGDVPFYYVQLPNLDQPKDDPAGGDGWAFIRNVQTSVLAITNTGMIVTIDIGEAGDIHPRNKLDVGERLGLWALNKTYGRKVVCSSPFFKAMQVEGDKARINFREVGGGLMVGKKTGRNLAVEDKSSKLQRFAIAGADKKWFWAEAVIDGDTVVVSSPHVPQPVAVRYAYAMNPEGCNLYNRDGLPASPFRSDNW
jgi:sialate O-acetylesterase